MRPMNETTLRGPHVLTIERYAISLAQAIKSWRQIDIVRNKNGLSRQKTDNESLVPRPFQVIRENAGYYSFPLNLNVARPISEGVTLPNLGPVISRDFRSLG